MNNLPYEIKLTYIIAVTIVVMFICFLFFVVMMYNRKQLLYLKEKQLRETEYQNELLKEELKRQRAIQQERERISHDMHDELGAGISALKLQVEFLKMNTTDESIKEDIDELLQTAESMNLSMREMLWSLNSKNDNLGSFAQYLCNYTESFFRKSNIQVNCDYFQLNIERTISSEIRRNLLLCLKEALNNTYKHSNANLVELTISDSQNQIQLVVKDNGTNYDQDAIKGNGLQNMQTRMESIGGHFQIHKQMENLELTFSIQI